jgi:hypothetical protein
MSCSADYSLVTCSQRRLVCADVCTAPTSRRYQDRKYIAKYKIIFSRIFYGRFVQRRSTAGCASRIRHTMTVCTE